jgi:hypothetical protein
MRIFPRYLRWGWFGAALPLLLSGGVQADGVAAPPPSLGVIAHAVEGAESSWGANPGMWRADPSGPQGPMQITAAAAADVGGGDRFDPRENRALGRAYLERMYWRFGSWDDAVAAYNWGPGRMDSWIRSGRPAAGLPFAVAGYLQRVLFDAWLPNASFGGGRAAFAPLRLSRLRGVAHAQPHRRRGPPTAADRTVEMLYAQVMIQSATR